MCLGCIRHTRTCCSVLCPAWFSWQRPWLLAHPHLALVKSQESSSLLGSTTFLGICTRCWEDSSHVGSSWTFGGLESCVPHSTRLTIHVCTETESWAERIWKGMKGFYDFRAARWRCPKMPQVQQEYKCFWYLFTSAEMADFSKKNMQ